MGDPDPWQEAVRGETLPPAAFAVDGLERIRGWSRLWRPTPMWHLLGLRVTQVVSGSAVASLPVTPWLRHPDGVVEIGLLADTVCGIAADTVARPRSMVVPLHAGYRPLRLLSHECRTLVGSASVVRASPDWVYVEGQVEDGEGRAVAHVSMHATLREVDRTSARRQPEPTTRPIRRRTRSADRSGRRSSASSNASTRTAVSPPSERSRPARRRCLRSTRCSGSARSRRSRGGSSPS